MKIRFDQRPKNKLTIELVPLPCAGRNLRSLLTEEQWDRIRREVYRRADYTCEICGGRGEDWPVECHEIWEYDDVRHVQKLAGFLALCPSCHAVKHIGHAIMTGRGQQARDHMLRVNGWVRPLVLEHLKEVFDKQLERNEYEWDLDISLVSSSGLPELPSEKNSGCAGPNQRSRRAGDCDSRRGSRCDRDEKGPGLCRSLWSALRGCLRKR